MRRHDLFLFSFLLKLLLCRGAVQNEFLIDEGVFLLTAQNFDRFLTTYPIALVNFHAPWCRHCKALAPEFDRAAAALQRVKPFVPLAKVDVTIEKSLASKYEVTQFPTVLLFRERARDVEFSGERTEKAIVDWVRTQADPDFQPRRDWSEFVDSAKLINILGFLIPFLMLAVLLSSTRLAWKLFNWLRPLKSEMMSRETPDGLEDPKKKC